MVTTHRNGSSVGCLLSLWLGWVKVLGDLRFERRARMAFCAEHWQRASCVLSEFSHVARSTLQISARLAQVLQLARVQPGEKQKPC